MKIAVLGAGKVGGTVGRHWLAVGHTVVFGVRDPGSLNVRRAERDIAADIQALSFAEAVDDADVALLAVPWGAVDEVLAACGSFEGKIVIDATNPIASQESDAFLDIGHTTSAAEQVAEQLPGASVFKSLNHVGWEIMADPILDGNRAAMMIAGPDDQDLVTVRGLIADLGFEPIHVGEQRAARLMEPAAMIWIHTAFALGRGTDWAFSISERR